MEQYNNNLTNRTSATLALCGMPDQYARMLGVQSSSAPVQRSRKRMSLAKASVRRAAPRVSPVRAPAPRVSLRAPRVSPARAVGRAVSGRNSPRVTYDNCLVKWFPFQEQSCFLDSSLFAISINPAFRQLFARPSLYPLMRELLNPTVSGPFLNRKVRNNFRDSLRRPFNQGTQESADEFIRYIFDQNWNQTVTTVRLNGVGQSDPIITVGIKEMRSTFLRPYVVVGGGLIVSIAREKNDMMTKHTDVLNLSEIAYVRDGANRLCVLQSMICHRGVTIHGGHYNVVYWCQHKCFMYDNAYGTTPHQLLEKDLSDGVILLYVLA